MYMSTNKTEHLGLHQWESTDEFHREEFNENFTKVDKAVSEAAKVKIGVYKGTNTYGAGSPNTLTFDFAPKLVMLHREDTCFMTAFLYQGERKANVGYATNAGVDLVLSWSADGKTVSWYNTQGYDQQYNNNTKRYLYTAIG